MPVLSSETIRFRLLFEKNPKRQLVITPLLELAHQLRRGDASIDLHLGSYFIVHRRMNVGVLDPGEPAEETKRRVEDTVVLRYGEKFILHPNQFALGATIEYLALPPDLSAYVIGRSSWGRLGLIIATAIGIHPNYKGVITLELRNVGEVPIALYTGERIAQVFFHTVDKAYYPDQENTEYLCSVRAVSSAIHVTEERKTWLKKL